MEPLSFRYSSVRPVTAGFTLIEMVVVLAIIASITTIAFSTQSSFNKTLTLSNTAYDIALSLRSAQSFGVSSRALGSAANAGYGLHFRVGASDTFLLFADIWPPVDVTCIRPDCKPGDYIYANEDTVVQTFTLGNGITIKDFCALSEPEWQCASTGALTSLDIVFSRPNPDAYIRANSSTFITSYTTACLAVTSPDGGERFIAVFASGQIIANTASCPL